MKRTKKQQRYRFIRDKEKQPVEVEENNLQASRFISEGSPETEPAFGEPQEQSRDEKLVENIKRAMVEEKSLATVLGNIQVVAKSGVVTLEGSVFTEEEKLMAGKRAAAFAGFNNINNNLQVISKG